MDGELVFVGTTETDKLYIIGKICLYAQVEKSSFRMFVVRERSTDFNHFKLGSLLRFADAVALWPPGLDTHSELAALQSQE
jgi:hypothetical protein